MKNILLVIFTLTLSTIFAQVTDTTFISADQSGKLYRTTVTIDQTTGKKVTTDDPITDTTEQLNIYRQAYTQEITRRMADYNVVYNYKSQITQVIRNAKVIEDQFKVYMLDTTGMAAFDNVKFELKNHPQTSVFFRVTNGTKDAQGKVVNLPDLQWSFTKAAGTWKKVHYVPGYMRLLGFDEGPVDFFLKRDDKNTVYVTLEGDYKLIK